MKNATTTQSGSALYYILIGVALFAALGYAVANMSRGGADPQRELRQSFVTEILQFGDTLRQAAQAMKIEGITPAQVSFENGIVAGYANAGCTSNACKVFHVDGGGVAYQKPEAKWLDSAFSAEPDYQQWWFGEDTCIQNYPAADAADCSADGLDNEDMVVMLEYVVKNLCLEINRQLGITNPADEAPANSGCHSDSKYTGAFSEEFRISAVELDGKPAGCFKQTSACGAGAADYYVFYRVLQPR